MVVERINFDSTRVQAFLSYARADNDFYNGGISWFRGELEQTVRAYTGSDFQIFQDDNIETGETWLKVLDQEIERAQLLIPILTPRFFKSEFCRRELGLFLEYETRTGRDDLILPIYLIEADALENRKKRATDQLAAQLYRRNFADWRGRDIKLRQRDMHREILALGTTLAKCAEAEMSYGLTQDWGASKLTDIVNIFRLGPYNPETLNTPKNAKYKKSTSTISDHHDLQLAQTPGFLSKDDEELIEDSKRRLKRQPWLVGLISVVPFLFVAVGLYLWWPALLSEVSKRAFVQLQQALKTDANDNSIYSFKDCGECPEMMALPSGSFLMGSPDTEEGRNDDEGPQHEVTIGYRFALSKYEVTRAQFARFVADEEYEAMECRYWNNEDWVRDPNRDWRDPGYEQGEDDPVTCVSWTDAQAYVRWLSNETKSAYRLPSEAEWEYAARAGTATPYFWGAEADSVCDYANVLDKTGRKINQFDRFASLCDDKHPQTAPVGSYSANDFGLHDMAGNVWEWVEDPRHGSYERAPIDGSAWTEDGSSWRVNRGGSWGFNPWNLRSANRRAFDPDERYFDIGLRVAKTLGR